MNMYPLVLKAPLKDYIWGGNRLKNEYGFETELDKVAEAWVLSSRNDGDATVINGELIGKNLSEVLTLWGDTAIGKNASKFEYFPLLIKLIDACDRLSVQVHPDDEYAMRVEGEFGKTEMWYVVDCDEGAKLIYGFTHEISKDEFKRRINDNTLEDVCNFVPVKKGDVFFIEAGTLHAIGKGILIAEVQQNSNTTYRVSDYGRLGADGKPRPLHVEKALDVTKTTAPTREYGNVGEICKADGVIIRELAKCELFSADLITLDGKTEIGNDDSFVSLVVLNGDATLEWNGEEISINKGASVFIPAGITVMISGSAEILMSWV